MTKTIILTLLIAGVFIAGSLATNEAYAAAFMKLGDIKGESQVEGHEGAIDIESWSWGETNTGTAGHGGGAGSGKVLPQDLNIIKATDRGSPLIMQAGAEGEVFRTAVLIMTRDSSEGQQDYLIITMENVMVSSYQINGSGDDGSIPTESVSLNFQKLEMKYIPESDDGSEEPVIGTVSKHGRK